MPRRVIHLLVSPVMWKIYHKFHINFLQYIPRNMHMVFALLCFVVVIHWLIFPYPSGLLHWHCGNLTIAPVPAKQPWWIWINTSYEFIMNDCITITKQSTTKQCAYFLGYTVHVRNDNNACNQQLIGMFVCVCVSNCIKKTLFKFIAVILFLHITSTDMYAYLLITWVIRNDCIL